MEERIFQNGSNPPVVFEPTGLAWLLMAIYLKARHPDCRLVKAKTQKVAALRKYLRGRSKSDQIDALTLAKMPFIDPEQLDEVYLPPAEVHALQRLTRQHDRLRKSVGSRKSRLGATIDGYLPDLRRAFNNHWSLRARSFYRSRINPFTVVRAGEETLSTFLNEAMPRGKGSGEAHHVYVACQSLVTTYELSMQSGVVDEDFFADLQDEIARELRFMEAEEAEAEILSKRIEELYRELHPNDNLRSIPGVGEHTAPIFLACVGIIAASVTMLSVVALPSMLKRGYNKSFATGSICAGGTLGILIPPSIMLVVYGPMAMISVGKLFFGAFVPGFVLSALYCTYIGLRSLLQPHVAPSVPAEERKVPFFRKTAMLLSTLVPPVILILSVLGSIFFGVAAPTEAAGVGAFVATLLALAYRRLNWPVLKEAGLLTVRLSGMIFLIAIMAYAFTAVFIRAGCGEVVKELILAAPGGKWGAFTIIMFIAFLLGFFIDWLGIVFIMVPIVTPVASALGFNALWFAIMICVNLQMSFLTPPFAWAIFIVRGSASPELGVTTADIIKGIIPFVILVIIALGLLAVFPDLILWLPGLMIK